jgi:16S rRNA (guanine966-N2)-methyltransferase
VRIVGGSLGGRVLRAPRGAATRPTSEKVREAVFAILGDVGGARVLDLFAGAGGLGIEALSRGAAHVTFVDSAKPALAAIRANLRELQIADARVTLHAGDAVAFAGRAAGASSPWNLVLVDPPYASDLAVRAATALALAPGALAAGATLVIEHDRRHAPPDALGSLLRTDERRYGDTHVSFYQHQAQVTP